MTDSAPILTQAFGIVLLASAPVLIVAMLVGAVVGLLQTIVQVQDQTVSYVIKLIAVFATLLVTAQWMMAKITSLFDAIFSVIPATVAWLT